MVCCCSAIAPTFVSTIARRCATVWAMRTPEVIEYVPKTTRESGVMDRFGKLLLWIALPFALFAVYRYNHMAPNEDISVVMLVATPAVFFGGVGLLILAARWIAGR